ncbi:MAG TPA: PLP-dependent transferase [Thermoanaerobaculia bacterium]|nr:PLP-dependent transferase [Thermoanaerobaculia bacterium]
MSDTPAPGAPRPAAPTPGAPTPSDRTLGDGLRGPSTRAVHAGEHRPPPPRRTTAVPIYQTAPFTFDSTAELTAAFSAPGRAALYSRYENPTVRSLEEKVAALEGAEDAVAFASGMGAIAATLGTLLASGDRLLAAADLYGGTDGWLGWLAAHHPEVAVERAPAGELPARLEALAARTGGGGDEGAAPAVVYVETPSNPLLVCCDLPRLAAACRRLGERRGRPVRLVVDGTFAPPPVQQALALGADVVIHSATKFLAGHSDVTAGLAAGDAATLEALRRTMIVTGACLDPHAAFLVARGIKTLALRMARQADNAERLARLLAAHPAVARVHWPGFDPVGRAQMASGGAMLAFELAGGAPAARVLVDALSVFHIIPSLGGVESGVVLPAETSHRGLTPAQRAERGIADGLVRVSCGIEDGDDLAADVAAALAVVEAGA